MKRNQTLLIITILLVMISFYIFLSTDSEKDSLRILGQIYACSVFISLPCAFCYVYDSEDLHSTVTESEWISSGIIIVVTFFIAPYFMYLYIKNQIQNK